MAVQGSKQGQEPRLWKKGLERKAFTKQNSGKSQIVNDFKLSAT
jgi:hypothetical protein